MTSPIARFDIMHTGQVKPAAQGEFVRYSDYERLSAELARARAERDRAAVVAADEANRADALRAELEAVKAVTLSGAEFAQKCAYIAARAARYAGDTLELPEWRDDQVSPVTVARLIRDVRGILDGLEPHSGRARSTLAGKE